MTVRPIVITGEPVLHRRAEPVSAFDDELRNLVEDMFETMEAAHGVGLAAPQIGVGLRIYTWQMDNGVHEGLCETSVHPPLPIWFRCSQRIQRCHIAPPGAQAPPALHNRPGGLHLVRLFLIRQVLRNRPSRQLWL